MKRFLVMALAVSLISVLVFVGCSSTAPSPTSQPTTTTNPTQTTAPTTTAPTTTTTTAPVTGKVYNLKMSHEQAQTSYYQIYGHIPFAQAIEKATNGRIKVTVFDSQTLMKSQQIPEGIKSGIADMGWLFTGYFPGQFDFTEGVTLPFLFPNAAVGSKVAWNIAQKYPEIQKQFSGLKVLSTWTTEPYYIVSRAKIYKTLDDFKGQKFRIPGGPPTEMVKALGATPMSVPMPDCYLNLQKGVFDGMPGPAEAIMGFRLYEVAPYNTYLSTVAMSHQIVMNMDVWNSLPKDLQGILTSIGEQTSVQYGGGVFDKARADYKDTVAKAGFKLTEYTVPQDEVNKWIDVAGKPVYAAWVKTVSAKGLTNAQQILDDIIKLSAEYSKSK